MSGKTHDFGDGEGPVPARRHVNGGGWVADTATVADAAFIGADAKVYGNAKVYSDAQVFGEARVYGNAKVNGNAQVYGNARVYGSVWLLYKAKVYGDAQVFGEAKVYGDAEVHDEARVYDNAHVFGNARVCDNVTICGFEMVSEGVRRVSRGRPMQTEQTEQAQATTTCDGLEVPKIMQGKHTKFPAKLSAKLSANVQEALSIPGVEQAVREGRLGAAGKLLRESWYEDIGLRDIKDILDSIAHWCKAIDRLPEREAFLREQIELCRKHFKLTAEEAEEKAEAIYTLLAD